MADSAATLSASLNALNVDGNNAAFATSCKSVGDESDDALNTTKDTVFSSDDEEDDTKEEYNGEDAGGVGVKKLNSTDAECACAECGKVGDDHKLCSSCKSVKYCSRQCQLKSWPSHKEECKKQSAKLQEGALFKPPPPQPDCPICMLPLPIDISQCQYQVCCSSYLCTGCIQAHWMVQDELDCPFCREVATHDDREYIKRLEKRAAVNDAEAIQFLAGLYDGGQKGLKQDHVKAVQLWMKAAKLGSRLANRNIAACYHDGRGVKKNEAKEKHHHELAAIAGYMNSRHVLGEMEWNKRNFQRACRHYAMGARAGHSGCLSDLQDGVKIGAFDRDEYKRVLQDYKNAVEESRSKLRENSPLKQLMSLLG